MFSIGMLTQHIFSSDQLGGKKLFSIELRQKERNWMNVLYERGNVHSCIHNFIY